MALYFVPPVPPSVLADTGAPTLLAHMSLSPMQTDIAPSALLARFVPPSVLTDTGAPTPLALIAPPAVLADAAFSLLVCMLIS